METDTNEQPKTLHPGYDRSASLAFRNHRKENKHSLL